MTHSIQVVGQKPAILPDIDLIVVTFLLAGELARDEARYEKLKPILDVWQDQLRPGLTYTPGCIELDLDQVVASPNLKADLVSLLEALASRLAPTKIVPSELLQSYGGVSGAKDLDHATASSVIGTIDKLRSLLT